MTDLATTFKDSFVVRPRETPEYLGTFDPTVIISGLNTVIEVTTWKKARGNAGEGETRYHFSLLHSCMGGPKTTYTTSTGDDEQAPICDVCGLREIGGDGFLLDVIKTSALEEWYSYQNDILTSFLASEYVMEMIKEWAEEAWDKHEIF